MPGSFEAIFSDSIEDRRALDDLFSLIYEELRRLASLVRLNDRSLTLNSTALVHEAWLKLKNSPHLASASVPHFKAIAAKAMRQVLVESARRRNALKRGAGEIGTIDSDGPPVEAASPEDETLALDAALDKLAELNPRQAQVVEYRFFGGLSVAETAVVLGVSESVVERDWRAAKAWLGTAIHS